MEKFNFFFLVLLTAASIVIVSGCSKDSKSSNPLIPGNGGNNGNNGNGNGSQASVFINGDGFDLLQLTANDGASYYSTEENSTYTSIVVKAGADTVLILLATSGRQTGTFSWNESEAISYLIVTGDEYIPYVSANSGKTTISEYGNVNGYIKGTFSGSVYKSETNDPVDIDGSFSIKIIADQ